MLERTVDQNRACLSHPPTQLTSLNSPYCGAAAAAAAAAFFFLPPRDFFVDCLSRATLIRPARCARS